MHVFETLQKLYRECDEVCKLSIATRLEAERAVKNLLAAEEHIADIVREKRDEKIRRLEDDIRKLRQALLLTNIPFRIDLDVAKNAIDIWEQGLSSIDKLLDTVDQYAGEMSQEQIECPTCEEDILKLVSFYNAWHICCPETQFRLQILADLLARKYQVETPVVILKSCPVSGSDTCTITPIDSKMVSVIYLDPDRLRKDGLRVFFHEFYHHLAIKKGLPNTEEEAEKFADKMMLEVTKSKSSSYASNYNMFEPLERGYEPIGRILRVSPRLLNQRYTPEIIATLQEVVSETLLTKLGYAVANLGLGILYTIAAARLPEYDKDIVTGLAAHSITRLLELLSPAKLTSTISEARDFGMSLARGDLTGVLNTLIRPGLAVSEEISALSTTLKEIAGQVPTIPVPTAAPAPTPAPTPAPAPTPTPRPTAVGAPTLEETIEE